MDERELDEYLARQPASVAADEKRVAIGKPHGRAHGPLMRMRSASLAFCVLALFILSAAICAVLASGFGYSLLGLLIAWALMFWALGMGELRSARAGGGMLDWGGALFGLMVSFAAAFGIWSGVEGTDGGPLLNSLSRLDGGTVAEFWPW